MYADLKSISAISLVYLYEKDVCYICRHGIYVKYLLYAFVLLYAYVEFGYSSSLRPVRRDNVGVVFQIQQLQICAGSYQHYAPQPSTITTLLIWHIVYSIMYTQYPVIIIDANVQTKRSHTIPPQTHTVQSASQEI